MDQNTVDEEINKDRPWRPSLDFYLALAWDRKAAEVCYDSHTNGYQELLGSSELVSKDRKVQFAVHRLAELWTLPVRISPMSTHITLPPGGDHFKLAFIPSSGHICFGDLNRDSKQRKRGGGTVCLPYSGDWPALMCQCQSMVPVKDFESFDARRNDLIALTGDKHRWPHAECKEINDLEIEYTTYKTRTYPCCRPPA